MTVFAENLEYNEKPIYRRASRSQERRPHTQEAVIPFVVDIPESSPTSSSKNIRTRSWAGGMWYRLKMAVAIMMVISSLCVLAVIVMLWPVLTTSTSFVMQCNPPFITTSCPTIQYRNK